MIKFLETILDWSELWATMLPVIVWLFIKPKQKIFRPVIIYLLCALVLYFLIDLGYLGIFKNNNLIYNILSIVRLLFFLWFFHLLHIPSNKNIKKSATIILLLSLLAILVFENVRNFNSEIFGVEAIVLIIYCINFFLKTLNADAVESNINIALLIVTGLAIYESCCFFVFLFYSNLAETDIPFAVNLWNVHNIVYIIMCLYFSRAFFEFHKYESIKS